MSTTLFLLFRVVHVLLGAVWLGSTAFMALHLTPAVEATGPAGGQVMLSLARRGLVAFFASIGGTTVLTGYLLYWRFTNGFDPAISAGHAGMAFGIGGVAGTVALIIGGSVIGRGSKKVVGLMEQFMKSSDAAQQGALMKEATEIRQRIKTATVIVLLLQVVAATLMAVGHYI